MMRVSGLALAGWLLVGMASPSWASPFQIVGGAFNGTQVGSSDGVEAQSPAPNGEQAELDFVNALLGTGFTSLLRTTNVDWHNTDTAGVLAFQLASAPEFLLVGNNSNVVLLRNVDSSNWGVLDLAGIFVDLGLGANMQFAYVSEFGEFPTGPVPVPEPTTVLLLGAGLTALGFRRRRRRRRLSSH